MFFDSILNFKLIVMSEKKVSGKVLMFTGIVIIVFLVAIFGFIFWEPVPEIIQGEAEATEVRISGKVPGRIERFLVDEGDQVKKGDTVAILDSPEVMAKFKNKTIMVVPKPLIGQTASEYLRLYPSANILVVTEA